MQSLQIYDSKIFLYIAHGKIYKINNITQNCHDDVTKCIKK